MNAVSLNNLWVYLQGLTLTADNKRWIADHLYEQARQEEAVLPYTMEEINARLDEAERQVATGQLIDEEDIINELENQQAKQTHILYRQRNNHHSRLLGYQT